jgi:hypothetical protein
LQLRIAGLNYVATRFASGPVLMAPEPLFSGRKNSDLRVGMVLQGPKNQILTEVTADPLAANLALAMKRRRACHFQVFPRAAITLV